jgi:aminopeptidase N
MIGRALPRNLPRRIVWPVSFGLVAAIATAIGAATCHAQDDNQRIPDYRFQEAHSKALALERHAAALEKHAGALKTLGPVSLPFDVHFYSLQLDLDPAARTIRGAVGIEAQAGSNPLSAVLLDLDPPMIVDSVHVGGLPATFQHVTDDLTVQLGRTFDPGEPFRIDVFYAGVPNGASALHFDTPGGEPLIWNVSEPFGARTWWPCQDTPADKADSVDVDVTVPSALTAISNGTLAGTSDAGGGKTTYHWRERYPIVPYLVSIAAHPYVALHTTYTPLAGGSMPVTLWSFPGQAGLAPPLLATTVQILQRYAGLFGEYPFVREKYDMAQFLFGGGMENETATGVCCWSVFLTAHETAHQWFGDAVTCQTFSEIWLNEGFATYCEALWDEGQNGAAAYAANIWENRWYGNGTVRLPPGQGSYARIFDVNLSYNKASWVLHMLRGVLGDTTFFDVLRAYRADPRFAYGTATTEDFESVAEAVSGRDLSNFFTMWMDHPYFPTYLYDWQTEPQSGGWHVGLSIEQLQTQGTYALPIQVQIATQAGPERFVVDNTAAQQSYDLHTTAEPLAVTLDPDRWILCTTERALHAPRFDRGLLVVNGVAWTVGSPIESAYADSVFSAGLPFEFWDEVAPPVSGYVPQLPAPAGQGAVPAEVLGRYSTVVWVADADLDLWNNTSIVAYLRAGGNVLLLSRRGQEYLHPSRSSRLGLRWAGSANSTLASATPEYPGFVSMAALGTQSGCAVFETTFDVPGSALLLTESQSFSTPRGVAAWRQVPADATGRPGGGHFAFVSGRPYAWEHATLRSNVRTILQQLFGEPSAPSATHEPPAPAVTRLLEPVPNPFNPSVRVGWELAHAGHVLLRVYAPDGRRVRQLLNAPRAAGAGAVTWDGRSDDGQALASGIYFVRFESAGTRRTTKLALVR